MTLLTMSLALAMTAAPKPDPAKYGWFTDYETAKSAAAKSGKPMLLVFRCDP